MIDIASEVSAALQPVLVELRELRATVEALRILACSDQTVRARIADHRVVATQIGRAWRVDLASLRPTDPAEIATLARTARGQT
jgi:hypothetical protein